MEYKHLWNLPMLPGFTDPANPNFEISEYFHRIQKSQCTTPPKMAEQQEYRTALTKWADDNGIKHPSCEYTHLFYSKEGYPYPGFIATKDIHPNEIIVEVPAQLTVTAKRAYQELKPIFDAHPDVFCKLPDNCYSSLEIIMIATYLIVEQSKGEQSWLYNVLRLWPKQVDTALIWERKELEELQDKSVLEDMIKAQLILEDFYKKYYLALSQYKIFKTELISKEAFFRMLECVGSRSINKGAVVFAPYFEFINHAYVNVFQNIYSAPSKITNNEIIEQVHSTFSDIYEDPIYNQENPYYWIQDFEKSNTSFRICTNQASFKKGDEVYLNYGEEDNVTFITFYGFCMEWNICDYISIPIIPILNSKKLTKLIKLLPCDNPCYTGDLTIPVYYHYLSNNLVTYAKLLLLTDEEYIDSKINIKLELAAIDKAIELIYDVINAYPTTLKQDMELLKSNLNSYRLFMSVTCRAWRKRIGYHQIYLLEIVKEMLIKIENGAGKKDTFEQPTKIEDGVNEFNLKLNRRMISSYTHLI